MAKILVQKTKYDQYVLKLVARPIWIVPLSAWEFFTTFEEARQKASHIWEGRIAGYERDCPGKRHAQEAAALLSQPIEHAESTRTSDDN